MLTLAQSWKIRLAELRGICRRNGERLTAELREWFRQNHDGEWWTEFSDAAERGEGDRRRMAGWVTRLRIPERSFPGIPLDRRVNGGIVLA